MYSSQSSVSQLLPWISTVSSPLKLIFILDFAIPNALCEREFKVCLLHLLSSKTFRCSLSEPSSPGEMPQGLKKCPENCVSSNTVICLLWLNKMLKVRHRVTLQSQHSGPAPMSSEPAWETGSSRQQQQQQNLSSKPDSAHSYEPTYYQDG